MKTFNEGDRVSHYIEGEGTVVSPYSGTGYATVQFDNGTKLLTDNSLLTSAPNGPTVNLNGTAAKPEPMFTVHVLLTTGGSFSSDPRYQQQAEAYLTDVSNWDTVHCITINRVKG